MNIENLCEKIHNITKSAVLSAFFAWIFLTSLRGLKFHMQVVDADSNKFWYIIGIDEFK